MLTRDQKYGIGARKSVQAVKKKEDTKDEESVKNTRQYGVMCHKLPILIHTAGLAQALAFVDSRKGSIYKTLLEDLGKTIEEKDIGAKAREADLTDYMRLTAQVMEVLVWYKRFAQSILGVDVSDTVEEDAK